MLPTQVPSGSERCHVQWKVALAVMSAIDCPGEGSTRKGKDRYSKTPCPSRALRLRPRCRRWQPAGETFEGRRSRLGVFREIVEVVYGSDIEDIVGPLDGQRYGSIPPPAGGCAEPVRTARDPHEANLCQDLFEFNAGDAS